MEDNWNNCHQINDYQLYEQPVILNHVEPQPNIDYAILDSGTFDLQNVCVENLDGGLKNVTESFPFFDDTANTNPYVGIHGNYLTCTLCVGNNANLLYMDLKDIIKHLWDIHKEKLYVCNVCKEQFHYEFEVSRHQKVHMGSNSTKKWECTKCPKKFVSRNLLEEHENKHNGLRPHQCTKCEKTYSSKYTLKTHEKTHETRHREYQCMSCNNSFLSKQNLKQHEETHKHTKEFSCNLCDNRTFATENNLISHMVIHEGNKKYACSTCEKRFTRKAELRDHERTHTGERPFSCQYCPMKFTQRSNLKSHENATHFNIKKNICNICGKGFKRNRLLEYHMNAAHTKFRPFKCNQCEKDFVYPEHLKKHIINLHKNEKPYSCDICNKNFSSRDNYNSHLYSHTNKKQYECIICEVGFTRKPALKKHIETTNHGNGEYILNRIVDKDPNENRNVVTTYRENKHMDEMTQYCVKNEFENVGQDDENINQYYLNTSEIAEDEYGYQYVILNTDENLQYAYENVSIPLSTDGYSNEYDNNQNDLINYDQSRLEQVGLFEGNELKYLLIEVIPENIKKYYNKGI